MIPLCIFSAAEDSKTWPLRPGEGKLKEVNWSLVMVFLVLKLVSVVLMEVLTLQKSSSQFRHDFFYMRFKKNPSLDPERKWRMEEKKLEKLPDFSVPPTFWRQTINKSSWNFTCLFCSTLFREVFVMWTAPAPAQMGSPFDIVKVLLVFP